MQGARRYFEEVREGEDLPSFEISVTRTHIVKYAGAGGDFNPIHHDEEYAKALGLPSVFSMGLLQGGALSRVVTDWAGDGTVKRYRIRFAGMVWPKDTITCKGSVRKKYRQGRENLVDCELFVTNQNGEDVILGETTVRLPSKG